MEGQIGSGEPIVNYIHIQYKSASQISRIKTKSLIEHAGKSFH